MIRLTVTALVFVFLAVGGLRAEPRLTVVELFTSQGCSSCPPAEAFLDDLAERDDILALAFHVDYWDYIGWKDPFASPRFTDRQRRYAGWFGLDHVYTPQMVVQGVDQMAGTHRDEVLAAIDRDTAPRLADVELLLKDGPSPEGTRLAVFVEESEAARRIKAPGQVCDIWLVSYDDRRVMEVSRGENAGRRLDNPNVVRSLQRVGTWDGRRVQVTVPVPDGEHLAALVQSRRHGRIIGAARLDR